MALLQQAEGITNGIGSCSAGGGHSRTGPLSPQGDGRQASRHVGDHHWHRVRAHASWPLALENVGLGFHRQQATNARADDHADALAIGIGDVKAALR